VIRKRLLINLVAFFALSIALVLYGITSLIGNPLRTPTTVESVFTDASGIDPHFGVELNGVDVGSVTGVHLAKGGALVQMAINPGVTVPNNVTASIDVANDLGEQVIELTPGTKAAPPIASGAVIPSTGDIPVDIGAVVTAAVKLLNAIPTGDLNSLLGTLATGLAGEGDNLRTIVASSTEFSKEFLQFQGNFKALLANAPPVLNAVTAVAPQLQQALSNTEVLMAVLAQDRNELDPLFREGASATGLLDQLLVSQGPNLACIFHDAADVVTNLDEPTNLSNLSNTLGLNQLFFGAINDAIQPGAAKQVVSGIPAATNQLMARTRLLIPPQLPMGSAYSSPNTLPDILPGAGCSTELGQGVGPATQPGFQPAGQDASASQLVPPSAQDAVVSGAGGTTAMPATQDTSDDQPMGASWLLVPLSFGVLLMLALAFVRRSPRSRRASGR
jgi:phospholipid/cholesterol/gamma-HCH transport system substrate-binding protein